MADFDPTDYGPGPGAGEGDRPLDFDPDGFEPDEVAGEEKQLRDAVLLLVDCTSRDALTPLRPGGRSLLAEALSAAATLLKRKVVSAPEDKVGVALYGVREKQNPNGFEGIRVLQELDRPSAQRIKQLEQEIARPAVSFEERYGCGNRIPLSDVFWTCTTIFNLSANAKQFEPRVWLFTSNDFPCDTPGEQDAAQTRARDLMDIGAQIEFFPLPAEGVAFSMERFWDRVVPVDEEDYVGRAVVTLGNLERWIRMREHRKRTLQRLQFELCPGAEIAVSIYCTTIEARVPYPVYLLNENNKLLKSESKQICASTGAILHPAEDIETYVEVAGQRVNVTRAEVASTKHFGEPGMKLLGFKAASSLQPHHRIFHSYFVYPNEKGVTGSSALCQALIDKMSAQRLMALVHYTARRNAEPCLVALLPQAEEVDNDGVQIRSPGFHMVRLPWAEEIRQIEFPIAEQPEMDAELSRAARAAVSAMRLDGFRPGCAENPVLQKHYAAVQALALGEDKPAETVDVLQPDLQALEAKAPLFREWRAAVDVAAPLMKVSVGGGASAGSSSAAKRAAPSGGFLGGAGAAPDGDPAFGEPARSRPRREAAPAAPETLEGMRELVRSGEVDRLTVPALRDFLKAQGVVSSGKKADLVARVRAIV